MVKKIFLTIFFFSTVSLSMAQTAEEYISQAQQSAQQMKEADALASYKKALQIQPHNIVALCQASILSAREGTRQSSKDNKLDYYNPAKSYAEQALQTDANNAQANYAMAFALEQFIPLSGAKEKVAAFRDIKKYVDIAIKTDSANALAWHLAGKWNDEVSHLGFAERTAANIMFGGLPKASLAEAIIDYEKCRQLDRHYIQNYYDLAVAYHDNGQDEKAMSTLQQAIRLRSIMEGDDMVKDNCRKMLEDLQ